MRTLLVPLAIGLLITSPAAWCHTASGWDTPEAITNESLLARQSQASAGFERLPVGSVHRINPTFEHFSDGRNLLLMLPDGQSIEVHLHQTAEHGDQHHSLSLHGARGAPAQGFLTVGPEAIYGKFSTASARYRIHSDAAGTWLIDIDDPSVTVLQDCPVGHHDNPTPAGSTSAESNPRTGLVQINKMIIYTPEIAERYPGSMIDTRMHHLIALTNQAMVDSGLEVALRLVHYEQTDYDRNVSSFVGLTDMRDALRGEVIEGLEDLATTRLQFGADLIGMVWAADIETRGACGVAFLPFKPEDEKDYDATLGVQISADGVTNWSVCSDSTFVHEVGHQLGAHHQRETFGSNPPDTTGFALVVPGRFNTVMSSLSSADINRFKRLNVYSSPLIQCGGQPCGSDEPDAEIHNAEVVAQFAPIVAGYMDSVLPGQLIPPAPSFPDSDGDGVNDWEDPYPFDPLDGQGPEPPEPAPWTPLPRYDGSELAHWELLIASSGSDQIHAWRLDGEHAGLLIQAEPDGFPDERPAFSEYTRIADHPDGLIYALSSGDVRRFDRLSGRQHDIFLDSQPPAPTLLSGGFPKALRFHPAGGLLLISGLNLLEAYDEAGLRGGVTGVTAPDGGFLQPHAVRDLVGLPGTGAFVALEALTGRVLFYQDANDFSPVTLGPTDPEQLSDPWALSLGPNGGLFIANGSNGNVLRMDPDTGVTTEWIAAGTAGLGFARDLAFGPDEKLYVLDREQAAVLRFDGQTGTFLNYFIGPDSAQLDQAQSMLFVIRPDIELFRDRFQSP